MYIFHASASSSIKKDFSVEKKKSIPKTTLSESLHPNSFQSMKAHLQIQNAPHPIQSNLTFS